MKLNNKCFWTHRFATTYSFLVIFCWLGCACSPKDNLNLKLKKKFPTLLLDSQTEGQVFGAHGFTTTYSFIDISLCLGCAWTTKDNSYHKFF